MSCCEISLTVALDHDLASGSFLLEQRNAVLVGGTGTGKSHLAIAIARACVLQPIDEVDDRVKAASRAAADASLFRGR